MVQQVVSAFLQSLRSIGSLLLKLAPFLAILLAAVAVVAVLLWVSDRNAFRERLAALASKRASILGWTFLGFVFSVLWLTLQDVSTIVNDEQMQQLQVAYSSQEDPSVSGVHQYGPLASYVEQRTFSRTLRLPPDFLERIGAEGVQVLSPYLQDPSAENVLSLADTFRRSGQEVVFTREVTRLEETPVQIQKADVSVDLDFKETGTSTRRSFYEARFEGTYVFKNPLNRQTTARFNFPLPSTGTIRDFSFTVNGRAVTEPDERGAYVWSGALNPGETATAKITYRTQGGGAWRYEVGSGQRRLQAFNLVVNSDEPARFLRGALYPTRREGNRLTWSLSNVITNQQVDLFFPGRGVQIEARAKALGFLPISLGVLLFGVFLLNWRFKTHLSSLRLGLATIGFGVGLGALAVLSLYVPLVWAVIIAGVAGTALTLRFLGLRYLPAVGLAAILPLAFVSEVHSGLIILLAMGLALITLAPDRKAVEE